MKIQIAFALLMAAFHLSAQQNPDLQKLTPKKFIDKVDNGKKLAPKRFIDKAEIVIGTSLCLNYGNKFIENYKDDFVRNARKLKIGYTFGVGFYHAIDSRLDINLRLMYEVKGTSSLMNTPGLEINREYSYRYLTAYIAPRLFLDQNRKISISLGGYYSRIQSAKGREVVRDTKNNITYPSGYFYGRQIRELRSDGSTSSIEFDPGLRSYQEYDYGIALGIGYLLTINHKGSITFSLTDNLGLVNINKTVFLLNNPPEKNHNISLIIGYTLKRSLK